jgi:hypothetical protein
VHVPSFFEEFDILRDKGSSSPFVSTYKTSLMPPLATEQDWIARADFSFLIARISSLTSTRSLMG